MTMAWTTYESPLGPLTLIGGGTAGLRNVHFPRRAPSLAQVTVTPRPAPKR